MFAQQHWNLARLPSLTEDGGHTLGRVSPSPHKGLLGTHTGQSQEGLVLPEQQDVWWGWWRGERPQGGPQGHQVEWSGSDERERLSGLHPPQLHCSTSPSFLLFFDSFFIRVPRWRRTREKAENRRQREREVRVSVSASGSYSPKVHENKKSTAYCKTDLVNLLGSVGPFPLNTYPICPPFLAAFHFQSAAREPALHRQTHTLSRSKWKITENPGGNQGEHSNKLTKYSKAYWVHHYIYNYILCSTQCVASWVDIFRKNKTLIPGNFLPDLSMCVDLIKAAAWLRLTTRFPFVVIEHRRLTLEITPSC